MYKLYYILIVLALVGCSRPTNPFPNNIAEYNLILDYPQDNNGYYHVNIDTNTNANRFNIFVEATDVIPDYQYNGSSVVMASFDCDSYFMLGGNGIMSITLPTYNPFGGIHTSPNYSSPFPVGDTTLILNQFAHLLERVVPDETIYLKEPYQYDEYIPEEGFLWGKRIVGPIPSSFYNDTIKVYCKIIWETGNYLVEYPEETIITEEIKIIFK